MRHIHLALPATIANPFGKSSAAKARRTFCGWQQTSKRIQTKMKTTASAHISAPRGIGQWASRYA
jgi:hypothetical protein